MNIENILPWFLSIITIITMYLAGEKNRYVWILGLFNQILWLAWIFFIHAWGLLPLTFALIYIYTKNHIKWNKM